MGKTKSEIANFLLGVVKGADELYPTAVTIFSSSIRGVYVEPGFEKLMDEKRAVKYG